MKIGDTITFDFLTHDPTTGGVVDADSLPTGEVFEEANDTSMYSSTIAKRTSKTGNYRLTIVAS